MILTAPELTPNEARLVALSDQALVRRAYELVSQVDNDGLSDEMYVLLTEVFERFAPRAEWAEHVLYCYRHDPEAKEQALEGTRTGVLRRAVGRLIAQTPDDLPLAEQTVAVAERLEVLEETVKALRTEAISARGDDGAESEKSD